MSNTHYCEFLKEYTVLDPEGQTEFISWRAKGPEGNKLTVCPEGSKTVYSWKKLTIISLLYMSRCYMSYKNF